MKINFLFAILLATILFACKGNQNSQVSEAEQDHEHEDIKAKITSYTENYEVFAEADAFVADKKSNVLTHFTHLNNFSPLDSASVTIKLVVGGKQVEQTLEKPIRKGIYSFDIQPETSGIGELLYEIKTGSETQLISIPDIIVYLTEEEADEAMEAAEPSTTNTIVFTKEQTWKIDFATELPKTETFGQIIKTTGQVQSAQGDEIVISAKTNGIVNFSAANLMEGKSISNGQVLFSISGSGFADNNSAVRFAEAKNNYEKATLNYERSKELAAEKIISEKELQNARFNYENAKAVFENLNTNFDAKGQSITSPINGFIKQLFVRNGEFVESGQSIAKVSQNKTLVIQAEVQQKYAAVLNTVRIANIRTLYDNKTYSLEELNGRILSFGRSTNNRNYLIPVNLQIDNKGSFIPGSFIEIYLKTVTGQQILTVPNSALIEELGFCFVFVQINPELFEKREIKTGISDGFRTEIIKGIHRDERIVTKGAVLIKLSQSSGALDAHSGHVH